MATPASSKSPSSDPIARAGLEAAGFNTPSQSYFMGFLNVAVQGLLILVIAFHFRETGYDVKALAWDDYALVVALVGIWYTRRPQVYVVV